LLSRTGKQVYGGHNKEDDSESEKAAFPYGKAGPSNDEVIFRTQKNLDGRPTENRGDITKNIFY
jgi:hypothetical protein